MKISRVFKTMSAHGYGQVVTILSTLIIPSVIVAKWGAQGFGYWVTMSALAQFFLMSDLGAATALSNQLCLKSARTTDDAWMITRSVLRDYIVKALFATTIITNLAWFVWLYYEQHPAPEDSIPIAITFMLLAMSASLQPLIGIYCAVWRFIGKNAVGIFVSNTVRLAEFSGIVVCALLGQAMQSAAATVLVLRIISVTVATIHTPKLLIKNGPVSMSTLGEDTRIELRSLKQAGHGFMLISLSQQLALHGPTLLISMILGPVSAAVFTACRTISRLPVQPLTVVLASLNPEFTELISGSQYQRLIIIVRRIVLVAVVISLFIGVGAVWYADVLEKVWLKDRLKLDLNVLAVLCLAATFYIGGQVLNQTLTSANQTRDQSKLFLAVTTFTIVAMLFILLYTHQILWAIVLVLVSECLMAMFLVRRYKLFLRSRYAT